MISIIVAVRNARFILERCLASLEPLAAVEILVADGASTDGTIDLLQGHAPRLAWWISEPDCGVADAWNKALKHARGEWILFLGADDWLVEPSAWGAVMAGLNTVPKEVQVAYGAVRLVSPQGQLIATVGESWERAGSQFNQRMSLSHQGVFHRRELFLRHGAFDTSFRIAADYEFLLRELPRRPAWFLGEDAVVANMTVGGLSLHGAHMLEHVREMRRAQELHGVYRGGWNYWSRWTRAALRTAGNRVVGIERAGRVADMFRRATGRPPIWSVR